MNKDIINGVGRITDTPQTAETIVKTDQRDLYETEQSSLPVFMLLLFVFGVVLFLSLRSNES